MRSSCCCQDHAVRYEAWREKVWPWSYVYEHCSALCYTFTSFHSFISTATALSWSRSLWFKLLLCLCLENYNQLILSGEFRWKINKQINNNNKNNHKCRHDWSEFLWERVGMGFKHEKVLTDLLFRAQKHCLGFFFFQVQFFVFFQLCVKKWISIRQK